MLPALAIAGLGLQFGGSLMQGQETARGLKQDAAALDFEATQVAKEGRQTAELIKKQGRTVLGAATTDLASSGFRMDSSQSLDIREEIMKNVQTDSMNAILSGDMKAAQYRDQARQMRRSARRGKSLGAIVAVGGLVGGLFGG